MRLPGPKRVLAAIPDLFFWSKVSGVASQLGAQARLTTSKASLLEAANAGADLVIVDLEADALDPLEAIREILSSRAPTGPRLVAFAGHTKESLLEKARAAGCDEVLTKGALASALPRLLSPAGAED